MAHEEQPGGSPPPLMNAHGTQRRRLAKAGLGAAGVLWTLESRATLKQTGFVCESPSAAASAGLNSNVTTEARCNPQSPSNWAFGESSWPVHKNTRFRDVFECGEARFKDTYYADTMLQVLSAKYDTFGLGGHLVTAYLNVQAQRIDFLDVPTLQRMWNELKISGHFKPAPKEFWNAQQVAGYLASVHGN